MGLMLVGCGALAVLYIFSGYLNARPVQPYLIGLAFIQLLIYFISMHILNVNHTLSNVEDMMSQPVGKLRRFNGRIAAMYLIIVAVLALAAVLLRLDIVFTWIGSGALALVRWLVSLMSGGGGGGEISEEMHAPDTPPQQGGMDLPAAGDPFIIWVILEKLVFIAFIAAAIVGIVYLLYRFYKAFNKNAVQELATEEFKESSAFVEKEKRTPRAKSNLWDALQNTPEKKIRRAYFHKISRYMKKGDRIKPADTPLEIERALKEQQDLQVLTQLYQKARYSEEPITKEEIRDVKT